VISADNKRGRRRDQIMATILRAVVEGSGLDLAQCQAGPTSAAKPI